MTIRLPAVAGLFYPDDPQQLHNEVLHLLDANPQQGSRPKVLVVPHAGYRYSGPVAARAFNLLRPWAEQIERVVLLGPAHRVALGVLALPDADSFETPLGRIAVDVEAISALQDLQQVVVYPEAHLEEHSLEVQLPFLQQLLGAFTLIPLVVGQVGPEAVAQVLDRLWGGEETLIVISTDLSHYHPYDEACRLDAQTSRSICQLDHDLSGHQACGRAPLNGLLYSARCRGMRIEQLDLRNSGDTAGTRGSVVGYGAYALY